MKLDTRTEQPLVLPAKPGVYLFRGRDGNVLYVGKAASLQNRVRSYLGNPDALSPKLRRLISDASDIDFIVTSSEQEAIILECSLIKKHHPRYNIRLKDDKSYPYLKIGLSEEWPRVYVTRRLEEDGNRYFGPFASASSLRTTMGIIKKLFPYRTCNKAITATETRPCLKYHIKRCVGPCIGAVSHDEYQSIITQVTLFLEGRQERVMRGLRKEMQRAASALEFEKAASLRDQLQAVERVTEEQKVVSSTRTDEDVIALAQDKDLSCAQVFFVRGGKVVGRENFALEGIQGDDRRRVMTSFVEQFYSSAANIPPQVLVQSEIEDKALLENWLRDRRAGKVALQIPRRGEKRKLMDMVAANAQETLEQLRVRWLADRGKTSAALLELAQQLHLPRVPQRIECYDISDIRGTSAVGSMAVFEKGRPAPSLYRRFKVRSVAGIDDYAMMREVLRRRFGKTTRNGEHTGGADWAIAPDLILIDGGWGHLNAAVSVLQESGACDIPVASIAKSNEEIFVPGVPTPMVLPRNSPALFLLQRLRDEAHRFALAYHLKLRKRDALNSGLDSVPGIGPKRKKALLKRFRSARAVKEASIDELASVPGLSRSLANRILRYL